MAAGLPRFCSFPACCATAPQPMQPWQGLKCLPRGPWLSDSNTASHAPSRSISPCPWLHESVAVHQGQTPAGGLVRHWVGTQKAIRLPAHAIAERLARFRLRVSRRGSNRSAQACAPCQAHRTDSRRSPEPVHVIGAPAADRLLALQKTARVRPGSHARPAWR